jgi:hypothetical protein
MFYLLWSLMTSRGQGLNKTWFCRSESFHVKFSFSRSIILEKNILKVFFILYKHVKLVFPIMASPTPGDHGFYNFHICVHSLYPDELEIKGTTESDISSICFISGYWPHWSNGRLTEFYIIWQAWWLFNFTIINFPFLCCNIPLSSPSRLGVQEHVIRMRIFKARPSTDKKVDVAML